MALAALLVSRIFTVPRDDLWRDWVLVLLLHIILYRSLRREEHRSLLTTAAVTMLLAVYLYGQFPYTLLALRGGR